MRTTTTTTTARPRGFTLVELLVVLVIVTLLSVVALPAVATAFRDRSLDDAAGLVHAAVSQARDQAARTGWAGLRLTPRETPARLDDGTIDPDAILTYGRIVPLVQPPPYAEGLASVRDDQPADFAAWLLPGRLVLEESLTTPEGTRSNPTSWYWTLRVGETVRVLGRTYTIAGPMVAGPADGNAECFVNVGAPGAPSPLLRDYVGQSGPVSKPVEFLYLCDRADDDGDGLIDEGFNGFDDDLDGAIDEDDEWERERWIGAAADGARAVPYTVLRRPYADPAAPGAVELPAGAVVDASGWFGAVDSLGRRRAPLRSRLPVWRWTGAVELTFDSTGRVDFPSPYGRPSSSPLGSAWVHFWVAPVEAVAYPPSLDPGPARLASVQVFTGRAQVSDADPSDVEGSLARAEGRTR